MKHSKKILLAVLGLIFCLALAGTAQAQQPGYPGQTPAQMVLPAGTWITARLNTPLSSDVNQPGDFFTATLTQPLVVHGLVVARRGQILEGRVSGVQRAGRSRGTSSLGFEITAISLVDGQQLPVRTQLIEYAGPGSVGQDVATVAATTGVGAAIGAAVDGGFGAGIGALAGAAASTIGVLVTRGKPTVIYPEAVITFRTLEPLAIYTAQSAAAFRPVQQGDYWQPGERTALQRRAPAPPPRRGYYARYYYEPAPAFFYGPYYYGPGFYGPRFYGTRFYGTSVVIQSGPRIHRHYVRPYRSRVVIRHSRPHRDRVVVRRRHRGRGRPGRWPAPGVRSPSCAG